jgi:hypothetical protein
MILPFVAYWVVKAVRVFAECLEMIFAELGLRATKYVGPIATGAPVMISISKVQTQPYRRADFICSHDQSGMIVHLNGGATVGEMTEEMIEHHFGASL